MKIKNLGQKNLGQKTRKSGYFFIFRFTKNRILAIKLGNSGIKCWKIN
ncbi:hypothetical protein [Mesomycoplasma ovipneumoniae]|uniref:Uncharacterized protein n=1 Tax=Mesomycoplasma ovipneumoniae TaxID=29562 RepID=A0AAP6CTX1_9BACT|nr:hypothetical protein [Mesomycoplasma ovipneumoniae]MDW2916160.1 hypothetical protein [Mesomycoplasma ovipneumoniae]